MKEFLRFGIDVEKDGIESAAVYATACLYSAVEKRIVEYLKPYQLSPSQFNALMIVKHMGKESGLFQAEISDKLILSPSNMTRLLDKLGREKLIERVPSSEDRRINYIKITAKGSTLLDNIWPGYIEQLKSLTNTMDSQELNMLAMLSLKWFRALEPETQADK